MLSWSYLSVNIRCPPPQGVGADRPDFGYDPGRVGHHPVRVEGAAQGEHRRTRHPLHRVRTTGNIKEIFNEIWI